MVPGLQNSYFISCIEWVELHSLFLHVRLLIGITVWLVASEARRQSNSWRISAGVITLLCLMILNNLIVRTQMWAWIPFVTTYLVLKRYTAGELSWKWLFLCPISMILWVNVHGSFILGLLLPGAFFLGETISKLLKQPNALNWHQIGWIGCTGVLIWSGSFDKSTFCGNYHLHHKPTHRPTEPKIN